MVRFCGLAALVILAGVSCSDSAQPQAAQPAPILVAGPALTIAVDGMVCEEGCVPSVSEIFQAVSGVKKVHADFKGRRFHCEFATEAERAAVEEGLRKALAETRFSVTSVTPYAPPSPPTGAEHEETSARTEGT